MWTANLPRDRQRGGVLSQDGVGAAADAARLGGWAHLPGARATISYWQLLVIVCNIKQEISAQRFKGHTQAGERKQRSDPQ